MDLKEYVIRQLGRTNRKSFEGYVINRIITRLDDLEIKFVTQQYVSRPEGYALVDLFFPQFNLHIEVDEGHHHSDRGIRSDLLREADIINATSHRPPIRIDVINQTLAEVHQQIDNIVAEIQRLRRQPSFTPWHLEKEMSSEYYVRKGYISVEENVAFRTIKDACNCFGHNYAGYQRAGASHPDEDKMLWFPKLYPNALWNNSISADENYIYEQHLCPAKNTEYITEHLSGKKTTQGQTKRIVFARAKDNLGITLYRFKGMYQLHNEMTLERNAMVWVRKTTTVKTFPPSV